MPRVTNGGTFSLPRLVVPTGSAMLVASEAVVEDGTHADVVQVVEAGADVQRAALGVALLVGAQKVGADRCRVQVTEWAPGPVGGPPGVLTLVAPDVGAEELLDP